MPPETSSFESSSISAGTADTALEEPPREIRPSFTSSTCWCGHEKGSGRQEKQGYLQGLCSQAEDSIPRKSLRKPGAWRTGMKVWHDWSTRGGAVWEQGAGERGSYEQHWMPGLGVWVLGQKNGIWDLNLQNSFLATIWRIGWRDKTGGRKTSLRYHCSPWMSHTGALDGGDSGDGEKRMNGRTWWPARTGQRGRLGWHQCLTSVSERMVVACRTGIVEEKEHHQWPTRSLRRGPEEVFTKQKGKSHRKTQPLAGRKMPPISYFRHYTVCKVPAIDTS